MPTVDVYNLKREKVGQADLDESVFGTEVKEHLFHEVVRAQLANRRSGNHKAKVRNEIRGSGHKPWRQKGTGRARHGDLKSNIFRGGGVVHGPLPRSYAYNPPKKVRKAAVRCALSKRLAENRLWVLQDFELEQIKTRGVVEIAARFGWNSAIFVDERNERLHRSARNLPKFQYLCREGLNVYDLLRYENVVLTQAAIENITGALAK